MSSRRTSAAANNTRRDFIHNSRFTNVLPDVPYAPKFVKREIKLHSFIPYHDFLVPRAPLLVQMDVGVNIETVDPSTYAPSAGPVEIHWMDQLLLDDEMSIPFTRTGPKVKQEKSTSNQRATPKPKRAPKAPADVKKEDRLEKKFDIALRLSREEQINIIEKTFVETMKPVLRHPTKKGVTVEQEAIITFDFEDMGNSFLLLSRDDIGQEQMDEKSSSRDSQTVQMTEEGKKIRDDSRRYG